MSPPFAAAAAVMAGVPASAVGPKPTLPRVLNAIRKHMGMDVAFISEITGGRRYFRHVDIGVTSLTLEPGSSEPAEDSYCLRVVDGRLPELIPDACVNAEALTLPATRALPVGAHLSVPIRLADGSVYGTFCCFSHSPDWTLTERDLGMMRVLAEVVAEQIQRDIDDRAARDVVAARIDAVINAGGPTMVYQPIVDVRANRVVAFECLARFASQPYRTPDLWFADAARVGRGIELETQAIRQALTGLSQLPESAYLTVNASPDTIVKGAIAEALEGVPLDRVVVEVTEHQAIERYEDIADVMGPLQEQGLRIAIDDAGAGYASFRHILNLHPHIVKLDTSLTRSIDSDRSRRALAAALCGFAAETGCNIVAEGVETEGELQAIRELGIGRAQGYHLGRPLPLAQAQALLQAA